ncbi:hypothetical protein ES707_11654 [subsurface metagenome]
MERINTNLRFAVFLMLTFVLSGCGSYMMNMPTPPSQIAGLYASGFKYEHFDCRRLSSELGSLEEREYQLVIAQQERIKNSRIQAHFGTGYGLGDGIEAHGLANVRGEKEAVRRVMGVKGCL